MENFLCIFGLAIMGVPAIAFILGRLTRRPTAALEERTGDVWPFA